MVFGLRQGVEVRVNDGPGQDERREASVVFQRQVALLVHDWTSVGVGPCSTVELQQARKTTEGWRSLREQLES